MIDPSIISEKLSNFLQESKHVKKYSVLISGLTMQVVLESAFMHVEA